MEEINVRKEDQILMSLVHFFVTKENYSPIYVHGVKDEIWLEKIDGPYRVIRINSNHINNDEQFKFDQFKIQGILKQVKKKTMSLSVNALNINLNEDDNVEEKCLKNIDNIKISKLADIEHDKDLIEIFPNLKQGLVKNTNGLDLIFNVTKDINEKTERENKKFEKIFATKKIYVTYIIIAICFLVFLLENILNNNIFTLEFLGANARGYLLDGQIYRLITYAFLHAGIIHLVCNMYSLYIIGKEIETKFGKWRYIVIYLLSAIGGGLLSAAFNTGTSVGASGAIFGLLGALLYFGYNFRLYLKDSIVKDIIPIIILNLLIGFTFTGIDNACHIGGLIAGYFSAMMVGIPDIKKSSDRINGFILLLIYMAFLVYLVFFR